MSASDVATNGNSSSRIEKKLKKRKRTGEAADAQPNEVIVADGLDEKAKRKAEKQEKKRAKLDAASADDGAPEGETKAERKARKAAKRAAQEAAAASAVQDSEDLPIAEAVEAVQETKADKKARKAARKAEKGSRRTNGSTEDLQPSEAALEGGYRPSSKLTALTESEVKGFLESKMIHVQTPGTTEYRPIMDFSHLPSVLGVQEELFKNFKAPTPIQAAAWPYLLAGQDVIGVAQTGSGKTLAFGLPCVRHVHDNIPEKGSKVKAVVLSPTRELAQQIYEQYQKLADGMKVKMACLVGGLPKDDQRPLLKKANIIIATPGRLQDFIEEGAADLSNVGYLVLDEADRMLDTGFEQAIRRIITTMPTKRQTLMFTATWPPSVRELASTFMREAVKITIGDNTTGELRANTRIKQEVEVVDPRDKEQRLLQLLKKYQSGKNKDDRILVFCLYKKEAVRVERFISTRGFRVAAIHGDMSQQQRNTSFESFRSGTVPLLVATDVAARGLDIPAVKVVINVTFPLTAEDYVHRIGRTGRAGADGLSITLFTEQDKSQSGALINVLKAANQPVPEELLKFGTTVKRKQHDAYGAFFRDNGEAPKKATKITFEE